jgi:hypothetical protein
LTDYSFLTASHLKDSRLAVKSRNPRKRGGSSENLRDSRLMVKARIPRNSRKGGVLSTERLHTNGYAQEPKGKGGPIT